MTKIDRESVEQAWEAIHDAALMRHKDGGAELARLVINADDAFEALAAERDALKAERDKAVAMKDALIGDKIMLRSELAAVEGERNRLAVTLGTMTARAKMAMRCQDDRFNFGWIVEEADAILALLDTPAAEALERVRAEEREACAKVAETRKKKWLDVNRRSVGDQRLKSYYACDEAFCIAAAIRARGKT